MHSSIRLGITLLVAAAIVPASRADEPAAIVDRPATAARREGEPRPDLGRLAARTPVVPRLGPARGPWDAVERARPRRRVHRRPVPPRRPRADRRRRLLPDRGLEVPGTRSRSFVCQCKLDGRDHPDRHGPRLRRAWSRALDLPPTPTVKVDASDAEALKALRADQVKGKVVLAELPNPVQGGSLAGRGRRTGRGSPSSNGWRS